MVRTMLIALIVGVLILVKTVGLDTTLQIGMLAMQMVYGFAFMVLQFVGIFWFLGKPKTTTILPGDKRTKTMDDYWGMEHIKSVIIEWMSLLTKRGKFDEMGGEPIKGFLLVGPPGTGKTYLMQCAAGTEGLAFHSIAGSGFQGMFIGIPILRVIGFVKKLKSLAKEYGFCIGYLDEIDALGSRGQLEGGTQKFVIDQGNGFGKLVEHTQKRVLSWMYPEYEAMIMGGRMGGGGMGALTQLLKEMDGIQDFSLYDECENTIRRALGLDEIDQGVVMFAGATNKPELMDAALKRAGRFDKEILVDKPDIKSRRAIIQGYLNQIQSDPAIDLESIVADTSGTTPADIKSVITADAVKNAVFRQHELVTQRDIEDAFQERLFGLENPISELSEWQRDVIATHESGHAVMQSLMMPEQRLVRVTIVRRGGALGYVMHVNPEDLYIMSHDRLVRRLYVSLAGTVSEEIEYGMRSTGDSGDKKNVVMILGALSQSGFFGTVPLSPDPAADPDTNKAMQKYVRQIQAHVRQLLTDNWEKVQLLKAELLEHGSLPGHEVMQLLEVKHEVQN
jgi:cell division protease FtsH